jgi:hypothetical protein
LRLPWRISPWQLLLLVFTLALCVTPFDLAAVLDPSLGARAAWFATLPALGVGVLGTAVAASLARRHLGQPFERTVLAAWGPALGYPYLAGLALVLTMGAPANLTVFVGVAHAALLPRLPSAYVAVMAGAVGTFAAYAGPEAVARCAEVLAPLFAVGLAVIFGSPLTNARAGRLLPLAGLTPGQWLSWPVAGAAGTIRGFLPLLVLGPSCNAPPRTGRLVLAAMTAWVLVALSVTLPVAIFDAPLAQQMSIPFLAAQATVGWQWLPVRSFVVLTLLVWYGVVFVVFATYLWLGAGLLHRLLPRLRWTALVVGLGVAASAVSAVPWGEPTVREAAIAWNIAVLAFGVLAPSLLWLGDRSRTSRRRLAGRAGART